MGMTPAATISALLAAKRGNTRPTRTCMIRCSREVRGEALRDCQKDLRTHEPSSGCQTCTQEAIQTLFSSETDKMTL
jgi:hypothetical protein